MSTGTRRDVTLYVQLYVPSRRRWLLVYAWKYSSVSPDCELYDNWEFVSDGNNINSNDNEPIVDDYEIENAPIEFHCKTLREQYNPVVFTAREHTMQMISNSVLETCGLLKPEYHFVRRPTRTAEQQQQFDNDEDTIRQHHDYLFDTANFLSLDKAVIWGKEVSELDELRESSIMDNNIIPPHDRSYNRWQGGSPLITTESLECWKCRGYLNFLRMAWRWKYVPPCVIYDALIEKLPTEVDNNNVNTTSTISTTTVNRAVGENEDNNDEDDHDDELDSLLNEYTLEKRITTRTCCLEVLLGRCFLGVAASTHADMSDVVSIIISYLPTSKPQGNKMRMHQFISYYR